MKNNTTTTPSINEKQQLLNLYNQGMFDDVVNFATGLVTRFPTYGFAWKLLGAALKNLGYIDESLKAMQKSVEFMPRDAESLYNLGVTLYDSKSFADAEETFKKALEINPHYISAIYNLGNTLNDAGRISEAETYYRHALSIQPDLPSIHSNLGNLLMAQQRLVEAESAYQNALNYSPENRYAMGAWYFMRRSICKWVASEEDNAKLLSCFEDSQLKVMVPFMLLAVSGFHPQNLRLAGQLFAKSKYSYQLGRVPLSKKITSSHQKLRIGYLSADFYSHATVYLMAGILEKRNTKEFDIYLYSYGVEAKDVSRSRIENACEVFRHVSELSDEETAQQILVDEIDILVDLKGYTTGARLGITALRPAPIIVSWLGYPATLGYERLADYIIGDATVTPLEHAGHFSETLALMPHCYQPNDNTRSIGACPTRTQVGLPENAFVFCTFNQAYKITPEMFDVWCRLLVAVPNSVLWLLEPHPAAQENLRREMEARGVDSNRLIFAPKMEQTAHLGRLQLADLAVDTFPYTSHTTASDALWAGVPLVTKMGETFASRVAANILKTMDLAELVTTNDEYYFNVALSLAQNPEKLAAIKQKIATQKQISPLFDTPRFARDLERLYQTIWAQELKGERKAIVLIDEPKSDVQLMNKNETKQVELRQPFQACPLCGSAATKAIIRADTKNHSLYHAALPSDLTWLECANCHHVFSQHYWTDEGLKQVFKNAHANQMAGGNPDQKRQSWKPVVQNAITVLGGFSTVSKISPLPTWLDVGCGDGGLVMTASEFGFNGIGLDARTQTVQALLDVGYQAVCGDFMKVNVQGNPFVISMMDVLEHIPNPCEALQRAHSLLHEKGVLVISLPNSDCSSWRLMGNANPYWIEIEHYHNFSRQRLTALLNQYGFDVVYYDIPFRYKAQMELYAVKKPSDVITII